MNTVSKDISNVFRLAILIILAMKIEANAQNLTDGMPNWFLVPPADTEEYMYTVSSGDSYSEAVALSLQSMAGKLETKVEALKKVFQEEVDAGTTNNDASFSSNQKFVMNQNFGKISVQGMQKSFEEEQGGGYKSIYENVVRITYSKSEFETFQIDLYTTEESGYSLSKYVISDKKIEAGASFEDMLSYMDESGIMTIKTESVPSKTGHTYFIQLGLSLDKSLKATEKETARQDSVLYEKFKKSKAFEELQERLKEFDEDQDDQ